MALEALEIHLVSIPLPPFVFIRVHSWLKSFFLKSIVFAEEIKKKSFSHE